MWTEKDLEMALKAAGPNRGVEITPEGVIQFIEAPTNTITMARAPTDNLETVYFIACGEFVKIGRSQDPRRRLAGITTDNPYDLALLRVVRGLEVEYHQRFAAHRHRNEWFRFEGELKAWLESELVE